MSEPKCNDCQRTGLYLNKRAGICRTCQGKINKAAGEHNERVARIYQEKREAASKQAFWDEYNK